MRQVNVLFIFLCLEIIQFGNSSNLWLNTKDKRVELLQERAHNMTGRKKINNNLFAVQFKSVSCQIYYYDSEYAKTPESEDKNKSLSKFYVCMNCIFAEWIQNKLFKFVKGFPLLYQSKLMDEYDAYKSDFKKSLAVLNGIMEQTVRFINILFNFLNIVTYSAFMDIDLLKTLLSFSFKINYINNLQYQYDEATENDINEFLREIKPMNLETVREYCSTKQMLLGNILVDSVDTNCVTKDLEMVYFECECENNVSINTQAFFEKIKFSDNLEVIFWYMKSVYIAIVKLISKKTLLALEDILLNRKKKENVIKLNGDFFTWFDTIHFFFSIYSDLPLELIDSFRRLIKNRIIDDESLQKLMKNLRMYNTNKLKYKKSELYYPKVKISVRHSLDRSLEDFMNSMINKIDDYKCFVNLLEFLYVEYSRYYTPYMKNVKKVFTFMEVNLCGNGAREQYKPLNNLYEYFNTESSKPSMSTSVYLANNYDSAVKNGCDLVVKLYQYCFETFIVLNDIQFKYTNTNDIDFNEVKENINSIINYLTDSTIKYENTSLNRITFNLIPLIPFVGVQLYDKRIYSELKRLVHVIMSELNTYGIDYCVPPSNNYLLFNNIDLDRIGKHNTYFVEWQKYIDSLSVKKELPSYSDLSKIYSDQYPFILVYDQIVLFKWKGELKPLTYIFLNINNAITSSIYVNALYDLYFKFTLVVMFYEAQCLMKHLDADKRNINVEEMTYGKYVIAKLPPESDFPPYFNEFISNYSLYMISYYSCITAPDNCKSEKMYIDNESNLYDLFRIYGVELDIKSRKQASVLPIDKSKNKNIFQWLTSTIFSEKLDEFVEIVDELLLTVKEVKMLFDVYESYYKNIPDY
ncbi:Hypothetical protein CINCED_3A021619 [Cinara cedri]|uniref:Uncharacterized protein n=1 Tax=Cinara cedri TaxID=506608 RepID=A0A5E4MUP1_9HEMI|nr:Hypothetical protein CINCED_3A021619 [Cinara cedri]